jgi:hypothetical protein
MTQGEVATVVFIAAMIAAWVVSLLDPWVGLAMGIMIGIMACFLLVVDRTTEQRSVKRHFSSDVAWDEEEPPDLDRRSAR